MENNEKMTAEELAVETDPIAESEAEGTVESKPEISMDLKDMVSSIVITLFGLYVLISGIHMSVVSQQMSDTAWYGTPGILPIIIGSVLITLSVIMFVSAYRKGERINRELLDRAIAYLKTKAFLRLAVAIGLLAIYIFVLFRLVPFVISTFLYLSANMIFFREKKYPIWKLLIISAVFTVALYLFFGKVAGVPLP